MDHVTATHLKELLQTSSSLCVSLYMPTHRVAPQEMRQDALRYKNLIGQARRQLGSSLSPELGIHLDEAERRLDDTDFWSHQGEGLAVFISASICRWYRLPLAFTEQVIVDDQFAVAPLLECLDRNQTFYVLTLSKGSTRLLQGDEYGLQDCELASLPKSLDDALWYMEQEKLLRSRGGRDNGSAHGEGEDTREPHAYVREYLLKVDRAVCDRLDATTDPVIIAGVQPTLGLFCNLTNLRHIAGELDINADNLSLEQLHSRAWPLVAEGFDEAATQAKRRYAALAATEPGRVATDLERIIAAAGAGRVDTFLVARPELAPMAAGFHERMPATADMSILTSNRPLERAIAAVLQTGGRIHVVDEHELRGTANCAAIMRY